MHAHKHVALPLLVQTLDRPRKREHIKVSVAELALVVVPARRNLSILCNNLELGGKATARSFKRLTHSAGTANGAPQRRPPSRASLSATRWAAAAAGCPYCRSPADGGLPSRRSTRCTAALSPYFTGTGERLFLPKPHYPRPYTKKEEGGGVFGGGVGGGCVFCEPNQTTSYEYEYWVFELVDIPTLHLFGGIYYDTAVPFAFSRVEFYHGPVQRVQIWGRHCKV